MLLKAHTILVFVRSMMWTCLERPSHVESRSEEVLLPVLLWYCSGRMCAGTYRFSFSRGTNRGEQSGHYGLSAKHQTKHTRNKE